MIPGSGYPRGACEGAGDQDPKTGLWTKRPTTEGQFATTKTTGTFKGIKREK